MASLLFTEMLLTIARRQTSLGSGPPVDKRIKQYGQHRLSVLCRDETEVNSAICNNKYMDLEDMK